MKVVITYFHYKDENYLSLIRMAFASAKLFKCETVLVTSADISIGQDATIKVPHTGEDVLMPAILEAQKAYIDSALFDCNSVLFSPDALVARPLGLIFNKPFDLAVTQGTSMEYPINNGVIYLKPHAKEKLSLLWADFITRCRQYEPKYQRWYGDQKSMGEVIAEANDRPYDLKVMRLVALRYNAILSHKRPHPDLDDLIYNSAYVIHFKGERKERMAEYWGKIQARECQ